MENKYTHLCLFRKDDVIDLFKNGWIYPYAPIISSSKSVDEIANDHKEVDKLFNRANPIDYSINYFILHFETTKKSISGKLTICDLQRIYPLDDESARIGLSFSPPIKLGLPIFKEAYERFQISSIIEDALAGINNIGLVFGYDDLKLPAKFNKKEQYSLASSILSGEPLSGSHSVFYYLLGYSRNILYPTDGKGCFLDALHAFANFQRGMVSDKSVENSKAGKSLKMSSSHLYKDLINILSNHSDFIIASDKAFKGYWKIAPLFFNLKSYFERFGDDLSIYKVEAIKASYDENDLKTALTLLGFCLGQEHSYKISYSFCKYPFLLNSD